jgi:hypothetical protein
LTRALAPALALALLVSSSAHAEEVKSDPWVGTWSGKTTSKGCVDPAPKKLTLEIAIGADGKLRSDGDVVFEGWGELGWKLDPKKKGLTLVRDGMTGAATLAKKQLKVSLRTDGACVVTATLKRTTSGIASCDRVRDLATVKAQCPTLPPETRGQALADVVAAWPGWSKLKGKKKIAQGKVCTEEAATLETEVGACGKIGGWFTGVVECDAYIELLERYYLCSGYNAETTKQQIDSMLGYWKTDPGMLTATSCAQWNTQMEAQMASMACKP